jgi:hypothetical protein
VRVGDKVIVPDRGVRDGEFQKPVEQHASAA